MNVISKESFLHSGQKENLNLGWKIYKPNFANFSSLHSIVFDKVAYDYTEVNIY